MSAAVALDALDLAALLCSRVCHDLISPTGAIVNGLEVLEEDGDAETKTFALDLIKKSARTASARLQFCRLAFGAAGSASAQVDLGDAETMAKAEEIVKAHVASHPELMAIPAAERAAAQVSIASYQRPTIPLTVVQ